MGGIFPWRHCWPPTCLKAWHIQLWICQRADKLLRGEKVGLQKEGQPLVFTATRVDNSQFYISVMQSELSHATVCGKGREQFSKQGSTLQQINRRQQTCRFTHMLPPIWTALLYHCDGFSPRNWSITLRLNNPPCLDIYGNVHKKETNKNGTRKHRWKIMPLSMLPVWK